MLNLSSQVKVALNSPYIRSFKLFELFYRADDYSAISGYRAGDLVDYNGTTYEALVSMGSNIPPSDGGHWKLAENPIRFADYSEDVVWQGETYKSFPIECGDMSQSVDGKLNDVNLKVANDGDNRIVQHVLEDCEFIGYNMKFYQFFVDPITDYVIDEPITVTFKIKSARAKKGEIEFGLSMGFEYLLTTLPNRQVFAGNCRWRRFKDENCKYSGSDTICRKTFEDCKTKNNLRNFGGFPAISNQRFYF